MADAPDAPPRVLVTHQIGDVRVLVDLPAGCPEPGIELTVFPARTTRDERAAVIAALQLTGADAHQGDGWRWLSVGDHLVRGGASATVHLAEGDDSIVPPAPTEASS